MGGSMKWKAENSGRQQRILRILQEGDCYFTRMNLPLRKVMPDAKTDRTFLRWWDYSLRDVHAWTNSEWVWEEDEEGNPVSRLGDPDKGVGIYKYSEQVAVGGEDWMDVLAHAGTDFIVLRYADILLLYAETLNKNGNTGEAYQYVDMVRERAGLLTLSTYKPGLSTDAFHEQIKHERFVELFGENVRFFDLKRWGMFGPGLAANDDNFDGFVVGKSEFAPIPQRALDLNENLVQNPGY